MTTPPPAPRDQLADAAWYVLAGAADIITDDDLDATDGLLDGGAEAACAMHQLPPALAPAVYQAAAASHARASGYDPAGPADPLITRALAELPRYPRRRQAWLLARAARHARP
jgi:hypothetical protein